MNHRRLFPLIRKKRKETLMALLKEIGVSYIGYSNWLKGSTCVPRVAALIEEWVEGQADHFNL